MVDRPGLDFSFSGLKTHALLAWQNSLQDDSARSAIAAAFQDAVVDTLTIKCARALQQTQQHTLVVAGGVSANQALQKKLNTLMANLGGEVYFPTPEYCTDNGAMVAYAGCMHLLQGEQDVDLSIQTRARWPLFDRMMQISLDDKK